MIAWALFLAGASFWLGRVGRKPEPVSAPRVEVVSLSGGAGSGLPAFTVLDRLLGVPVALARTVSGRGSGTEGKGPRSGGKRPG